MVCGAADGQDAPDASWGTLLAAAGSEEQDGATRDQERRCSGCDLRQSPRLDRGWHSGCRIIGTFDSEGPEGSTWSVR